MNEETLQQLSQQLLERLDQVGSLALEGGKYGFEQLVAYFYVHGLVHLLYVGLGALLWGVTWRLGSKAIANFDSEDKALAYGIPAVILAVVGSVMVFSNLHSGILYTFAAEPLQQAQDMVDVQPVALKYLLTLAK